MAQNPHFALTVGQAYQDHALALSEAHELQGLLRNISQKAQSFLDSIITVRLSMRCAGWDVRKSPPVVVKDAERPAVLFTFREHSTLPGEWPWYGAHDLNHESVILWKQWMEERGASGLQRWHVEIAAQRGTKEATRWTTVGKL
ncbi:hypothetical protein EKO04_004195 [Ascochyta lentis]|uniref:Uncharacterized protein n=1 Tax=Ascochyta lentis TaxID=205686 RepID=A0A8H7MEU7_9PLEO|nr:hypothetical protein EKO04_004195 [Ascochyta lentis]